MYVPIGYLCSMIQLGNYNTLTIARDTSVGLFLTDGEETEILLPNKYVPATYDIGQKMEVFCYLDHSERPVATTIKPLVVRNQFAVLEVAEVNDYGAFMDWGLEKHLLVPFREQPIKMKNGHAYVIHCHMDEKSFRLLGSARVDKFLDNAQLTVETNEEVELLFYRKSNLGWEAIVNQCHKGLLFFSDVHQDIQTGTSCKGYIKSIREDHKLDLSMVPIGHKALEPMAQKIFNVLKTKGGFLPLHDKSDPVIIQDELQMSKKMFKKGVGILYKEKKITLTENGIQLVES